MAESRGERPEPERTPSSRGVTTVLRYALFLVIVTILIAGLFVGVSGFLETQEERAIRSQFDTVGNRLAADLTTASNLVTNGESSTEMRLRTEIPDTVAGSEYRIEVSGSGPRYELTLRSVEPEVETSVVVRSTVPIEESTVTGGRVKISYDGSRLVVDDA